MFSAIGLSALTAHKAYGLDVCWALLRDRTLIISNHFLPQSKPKRGLAICSIFLEFVLACLALEQVGSLWGALDRYSKMN